MSSLLESIERGIPGGAESLMTSVAPLLKLLCLGIVGLVLGHPKINLIPKETFKLLSKLVFGLFLPCLIFTELGKSVTLENMREWWFIPINVLISTAAGCILGCLVVLICRPPPQYFRFTVVMTGFGNTGNLSLAVIGSICHGSGNPFGLDCKRTGVAYVSFAQWIAVVLVYSLAYHMLEPPEEFYEVVSDDSQKGGEQQAGVDDASSRSLLMEAEWPAMKDEDTEHCRTPLIAGIFSGIWETNSLSGLGVNRGGGSEEGSGESLRCLMEPKMVRRIRIVAEKTPIQHIFQPPTIASLLAILVGMVPQFRTLLFGEDAPMSFVTDSLEIVAGALVPSVMLVLGGLLAEGPDRSELGLRTIIGISVTRLVLLPLVGMGLVALAGRLGILVSGDKMFVFVLLLHYTTPSAILLGAMASLRGYGAKEASSLLFWQHVFAVASFSIYVTFYFKLLNRV